MGARVLADVDVRHSIDNSLSKVERNEFFKFLHDLNVPSGYSSNFKRLVSVKDMKMNFNLMKSHDCHVLMTTLLPVALRGIKTELVHDAVTRLCLFFNAIEQKVIDEKKLLDLERRHFETLCLLEATFPPSFFDLMLHLIAHLMREIWFFGSSHLRQMFPYERFFGFLKSLVHNRLFSTGDIVRAYETIETMEWAMAIWTPKTSLVCLAHGMKVGFQVLGSWGKKLVTSEPDAFQKAHFTVIQQLHLITQFSNDHKRQLCQYNPDCGRARLAKMHTQGFSRWLRDYVETCKNVVITDKIRNQQWGHFTLL
jgi:hypothetical protein